MASITVSFTLDDKTDHDLLRWLDSLPKREKSRAIRKVLRAHLDRSGITLGDVYQAVKELGRKLQTGIVIQAENPDNEQVDEPPDIVATLDKLGL